MKIKPKDKYDIEAMKNRYCNVTDMKIGGDDHLMLFTASDGEQIAVPIYQIIEIRKVIRH